MSGITAAQYLKRKLGIVVYAKVEAGTTYCIVRQGDKEISKIQDDPFGTLCWLTCSNLFDALYVSQRLRRKYPVPPVSHFFTPFNADVIKQFDLGWFVDDVLPKLHGKTNVENIANQYTRFDFNTEDPAEKYEIYDWIVQVYVELRKMKWPVGKVAIPEGAHVQPILEAIANLSKAKFVSVTAETSCFLAALQAVYPQAREVDGVWVCNPQELEVDPLGLEDAPHWFKEIDLEHISAESEQADLTEVRINATEDLNDTIRRVLHILTTPHQHLSPEDVEFSLHGGNPDLLNKDKGGLGKHKLGGLGKICGVGPLEECVERLATHLKRSLAHFPDTEVYNLAAGRIARMASEKKAVKQHGKYCLVARN